MEGRICKNSVMEEGEKNGVRGEGGKKKKKKELEVGSGNKPGSGQRMQHRQVQRVSAQQTLYGTVQHRWNDTLTGPVEEQ